MGIGHIGSCQKKVQRDFEKPSFEEKTRFLALVLDMSGHILCRLIAICVMLASLCGCEIVSLGEDRHVDTQSQLDYNRKKWDAEMASNYQFGFEWSCYCIEDYVAPVNITVRDNRVRGAAFVEGDVPIPIDIAIERYQTIDELFNLIQSAIDANADSISVEYHPESGYPTQVWIDYDPRIADEERGFTVHSLILE